MPHNTDLRVTKRNGDLQEVAFDKILNRLKSLGNDVNLNINYHSLTIKIIDQLFDTISTCKIDELSAEQCASLSSVHSDYSTLSSRIVISNHHKNTDILFSNVIKKLYNFTTIKGEPKPLITSLLYSFVEKYENEINKMINYDRDYLFDYFGFKTLERAYLFRVNDKIVERPQHMWMRVALGIHADLNNPENSLRLIKETYDLMSLKYFTHATPTLFNAGTPKPQLSSCFLLAMEDDSLDGIYNTLQNCAKISKYAGGIGLHIHNIRAKGTHIHGTNGVSNGLVPMLRVFNSTARYVDQGGGKRNGSFAIYLEPWHADIEDFLELKKNHGDEELKARDLFYAIWTPDLFMERVKENKKWSLFCPHECPGLDDVYGDNFKELYEKYETTRVPRKIINARDLWFKILDAQMETGTPYILYKDAVNNKSNQQNLGTIKSSNLCTEITEFTDKNEHAVCNLASIGLPTFVDKNKKTFDYSLLHNVVKTIATNLNKVIDINFYPTKESRESNLKHRPIGIGVQGLADVFFLLDIPFHSDEAKQINIFIFETIYHAALEKSVELSMKYGSYASFDGSPASKGILQFDMWNEKVTNDRYNWTKLKQDIVSFGLRNSLLVAPMPTASTSQILGFNECFEPITSNLYSRRTIAGEFVVINKYLMAELIDLGLWNEKIKNSIVANKGSIQHLTMLSDHMRNKYKIVWEIPMKHVIDMSADRGIFICQSQSLNLWIEDPTYNALTSMHFYSWKKGLKTGIYYLRRKSRHQAQQFTIEPEECDNDNDQKEKRNINISNDTNDTVCEMCSA